MVDGAASHSWCILLVPRGIIENVQVRSGGLKREIARASRSEGRSIRSARRYVLSEFCGDCPVWKYLPSRAGGCLLMAQVIDDGGVEGNS